MKIKNLFKVFLLVAVTAIFSCSSSDDNEDGNGNGNGNGNNSITVSANVQYAEFNTPFNFSVTTNDGIDVTAESTIFVNGTAITGMSATPATTGAHTVHATYNDLTSADITINVTAVIVSIAVEPNASEVSIGETIEYAVTGIYNDGETIDISAGSNLFINGETGVFGNKHLATEVGSVVAYATYNNLTSSNVNVEIVSNAGSGLGSYTQKALIEDYTGTWCGWCPRVSYGIELVEEATDNAIVVAVHDDNEMGNTFVNQLGATFNPGGSYPTAIVNRSTEWTYPEPNNVNQITNLASGTNNVGLAVNSLYNGSHINVSVSAGFAQSTPGAKLVVFVLESGLVYTQQNYTDYYGSEDVISDFVHNHVLRYSLTEVLGDAITDTSANDVYNASFDMTLPNGTVSSPGNLEIVAMVVGSNNQLINVQAAHIGEHAAFQ